ncbi:sugar-binding protein [Ferruginibacter albus]|uniref:sugar-binding protein n=1 Tax=Ferruginibacter albus TaxID=2875540 RepID=UPI001CC5AE2E|nr:sugar-binding protein [Ferruginibacter albus]UAY50815.1 gliding motility-associated C-terminal domain-containing protein [Ferruginibacter albus]
MKNPILLFTLLGSFWRMLLTAIEKTMGKGFFFISFRKLIFPFLLIASLFCTTNTIAQTFCQTWSLASSTAQTANSGNSTTGNTELIGAGMATPTYTNSGGFSWQRFNKPGGVNWPATVNTADNIYLEFPITPATGNNLTITSITFNTFLSNSSGSLIFNVYDGTTPTGATGTASSTSSGSPDNVSIPVSISVPNGSSKSLRLYITGNNGRTLAIKNVVICGTSTAAFCANATLGANTAVAAGTMGAGTTSNILTNFSVGAQTALTLTNFTFPFTNSGLTASDISNYKLYYTPTNIFTGATLLSTVTTNLTTSPINFGPFSQSITANTAGYFWVTTDVAGGATSGHSITPSAIATSNLTFSGTPTTCGSIAAQGAQQIIVLSPPTITTTAATGVTSTTATTGGNVTSDGGSNILERGIIYSTSPITDTNSTSGGGKILNGVNSTGSFSTSLTGLQPNTTYYVKAFAVNSAGVTYGTVQTFTTPPTPPRNCLSGGTYNGWPGKYGSFYLYAYAKAGEKIDWDVIRTNDGGNPGTWTINIYTPTGFLTSCTINGTVGSDCTTALQNVTAGTEGIWTLEAIPTSTSDDNIVCPRINVYNSGGTEITGRTWTESLHGHDNSSGVEPDFTLYFLTPGGYQYSATYSGMNGLYYTIVSDSLGVRTAPGSCTSAYSSVSYSGVSSGLGPDDANCGPSNKIFFSSFDAGLPASAPRFNVAAGSGQVTESLLTPPVIPTLSNPVFSRTSACLAAGKINFNVTNFTGSGVIEIDVNNNGSYDDPVDIKDTLNFSNGANSIPFNGLDGLGNQIPIWQPMNVKVLIDKIGETHFVQTDIEIFGGLRVTRLNGPQAPDNTIYWNDTNLPSGSNCSTTPLINGSGGVNSSGGGVHDWTGCGSSATDNGTNSGSINQGSWGNQRLIDNWAYVQDSSLTHTLFVAPVIDTTFASVCTTALPYVWSGHTYNTSGTFNDTLTSSSGCDSISTLVLSVTNCGTSCDASMIVDATSAITINGSVEAAWSKALPKPIQKATIGTIPADFVGTQWRGMYDANNLYLLVQVNDPNNQNDGPNWWDDDAVEIFIDGNNSKGTSYDADDFQFGVKRDGTKQGGTNIGSRLANITTAVNSNAAGYTVEIAIPWTQIGGVPTDGRTIGIDVQVDDDDDGGARDRQVSWSTNNNQAFTNPSLFGQAPLKTCTPAPLSLIYDNTNPSCSGFSNGSIKATGNGGTPPYTYTLTGPGGPYTSTTGTFSGLAPGNYIVTVMDAVPNTVSSSTITITSFDNPLIVSNDTTICPGSAVQLSATGGSGVYTWSPAGSLNNPNIANPTATPTSTTTYTVTTQTNTNLITNPDFEAGNVGFTSDYINYTSQTIARQSYAVGTNPQNLDQYFTTCPDHTTGSGKMLIVDGSDATNGANYTFWQQSIPVNIGSTYTFSYWIQKVSTDPARGNVQTQINGTQVGSTIQAPATTTCGNWQQVTQTWVANSSTATISLYDLDITGLGNDFTIDDMNFSTPCTVTDTVKVIVDTVRKSISDTSVCSNSFPVVWNSNTYNAAGSYNDTLTSLVTHCDSIATLHITIKPISTSTKDSSVCSNALPITWNGKTYSTPGSYQDTLVNSVGCDSIATLNLTIKAVTTKIIDTSVCNSTLPFNWNGHNYSSGGSYKDTLVNSVGCDSILTLNLTIKDTTTSDTVVTKCSNQLPFVWNGNNYNTSTVASLHFTNSAGCDSIATLHFTVKDTTTSDTVVTRCSNQLPFVWNGNNYNASTVASLHFTNSAGCDSIATLHFTVKDTTVSDTVVIRCSNQLPFVWNGNNYSSSTVASLHFTNSAGCDSIAMLHFTVKDTTVSDTVVTKCSNQLPFVWNGNNYTSSTVASLHFTNSAGCDSIATLHFTVKDTTVSDTVVIRCSNQLPFVWNGNNYTSSTVASLHFTNSAGCDSIATLHFTVKDTTVSDTVVTRCSNQLPFVWNGNNYSSSTVASLHFTNSAGCDSIATLHFTVKDTTVSDTVVTRCSNQLPFVWNGNNYSSSTVASLHFTNSAGCDSIATLHFTVKDTTVSDTVVTRCSNQLPFVWNGNNYSSSTVASLHFTNSAGCDSIATLHFTVKDTTVSDTVVTRCSNQLPFIWNGNNYSSSTVASLHFTNSAGCDSIATLHFTVKDTTTSDTVVTRCSNQLPFIWNGNNYTNSTTASLHFTNSAGCDSIATLHFTVKDTTVSDTVVTKCSNQLPFVWNGNNYISTTTASLHFTNSAGCDSIATLHFTVKDTTVSDTVVTRCSNQLPFVWNGNNYNASTVASLHFTNSAGCDSIATLHFTVKDTTVSDTVVTRCSNQLPFVWNGNNYNASTVASLHFTNSAGCDSIATLHFAVKDTAVSDTVVTRCSNQLPFVWNGNNYNASTVASLHFTNSAGCDSIATLHFAVKDTAVSDTVVTRCSNQLPFVWNGNNYNASTVASLHFTNSAGCDSIATLHFTVKDTTVSDTVVTKCSNQLPFVWNGNNYSSSTVASLHFTNSAGCDSIATLHFTVKDTTVSDTVVTRCSNQLPFVWNGNNYSSSTVASLHFTNSAGCDSIATLHFAVKDTAVSDTVVTRCSNQLPFVWNGNNYNASTVASLHFTNSAGCDSIATLHFAVKDTAVSDTVVTRCSNQLPFVWNGNNYNASTVASLHFTNSAGCDSIATLHFAVKDTAVSDTVVTRCSNQLPFVWNGNNYNASTVASLHFTNSAGCDSIATLHFTVKDTTVSDTVVIRCSNQLPFVWNGNNYTSSTVASLHFTNSAGCDSIATLHFTVKDTTVSDTVVTRCSNQLPFVWNGNNYNASTVASLHFTNSAGCDSIATLHFTVKDTTVSDTVVTRCSNQLPFVWNGNNYSSSTVASLHFANSAGCDSIATLHFTVKDTTVSDTVVTRCSNQLPFVWNGNNYSSSTVASLHFANSAGCDSIATLHFTVKDTTVSDTVVTRCSNQLPFVWNGNNYNASTVASLHFTNSAGCDSIATLHFTVKDTTVSDTVVTRCSNQLPFVWNGNNYTSSTVASLHFTNSAGCDSIATLHFTVKDTTTSDTVVTRCSNQLPFVWNGNNYNASTVASLHFTNSAGCDSIATLHFTVKDTTVSDTVVTRCSNQLPFVWNGNNYNTSTVASLHFTNSAGCDSIATLHFTVKDTTVSDTVVTRCSNQLPFVWNGNNYTSSTVASLHFTNSAGCDSIATLHFTVKDTTVSDTVVTRCSNQLPFVWNGNNYSSSTVASLHFTNSAGCDSIATLHFTVKDTTVSDTVVTRCSNQLPFVWNGNNYSSSTVASLHFTNSAGCDSIATLHFTVKDTTVSDTVVTRCSNQLPFVWNGNNYSSSTVASLHFTNSAGCDSIATLHFTVKDTTVSDTVVTRCSNQLPFIWNGNNYSSSTVASLHFTNSAGCDSIATLHFTVKDTTTSDTVVTRCSNQLPFIWNGNNYTNSTTASLHFTNSAGCDSIATLHFTVKDTTVSDTVVTKCSNQLPFVWNGNNYISTTTASLHFTNSAGCDSIATLHFTVKDTTVSDTVVTRCSNQLPFVWNGNNYNASTVASLHFTNSAGCDSIATLHFTVKDTTVSDTVVTRCSNQLPFVWNGNNYNASTVASLHFTNSAGCDSIATLHFAVKDTAVSDTVVTRCSNQLPFVWNGNNYNASTVASLHFTNSAGCDSIATLHFAVKDTAVSDTVVTRCSNQLPFVWNGNNYNASTVASLHFTNSAGCDSIATLHFTVKDTTVSDTVVTKCSNQLPFVWNGNNYSSSTVASLHFTNSAGCDSIATLHFTVKDTTVSDTVVTRCSNQLPFVWNGNNYSSSTVASLHFTNSAGCDSIATLHFAVKDTAVSDTVVTRCSNQLPFVWNGNNYNASTVASLHFTNSAGCDSIATLHFAVKDTAVSDTVVTRCSNQLPFVWNGNNYNASTVASLHFTNSAGCDSIATLHFTVKDTTVSDTVVTRCSNQLPFVWNGNNYTSSTVASLHFTNSAGCDSIATLHLIVSPPSVIVTDSIKDCSSVTFNGITYTSSASVTDTTRSGGGCDSLYHTTNIIITPITPVTVTDSIKDCSSVTFNGITYTSSASVKDTTRSAGGCDSLYHTTNIIIAPITPVTVTDSIKDCSSVTFNGITYTSSASVTDTTRSAGGCDSLYHTTNIIIAPIVPAITVDSIKDCSSVTFNGITYTSSASVTDTTRSAGGCDSLYHTTNIIIAPITPVTVTDSIKDCSSVTFNGITYTSSASVTDTTRSAGGCDSLYHTTNIIIAPIVPVITVDSIKDCSSVTFNGITYTSSASVTDTTRSAGGCDSLYHTTNIIIAPIVPVTVTDSIKDCSSVTFNGITYTSSASVTDTTRSAGGCDSLYHTTNIIIAPITPVTVIDSIKDCSSVTFNGITYTSSASVTDTTRSAGGCDSLYHTTNIIIAPIVPVITVDSIKDCSSVTFNGITYTSSASVTDTTRSAGGCDSLYHTTNIIITPITPVTVIDSIKDCSSVTFNGITYTTSASVTDTTRSAGGCDSLYHTTNIIITPITPVTVTDSIKDCSSVTFNGITYTSSASVTDTTRSAGGCDSLYHTTNIIIAPIVPVITVDSIKDCSSVTFNGITYTSSASVTDTTRSAGGCDSLYHTTNIIIAPITPVTVIDSIKDCSSVTFNGITYTSSASVTDTTRSAGGCDSLYHTTNIIIAPIVPVITVDSIKDCSSVTFNGITYTSSASVTDTTRSAGGCDSLYHTTNIIIAPIVPVITVDSIKDCSSITFNGITYTSSASVTDTTRSAGGCDSLYHTTNIIIAPITPVTVIDSIKDCSSVTFNGITYTSSASVTDTTRSAGGCDSLYHTTNIIIAPIVPVTVTDSIKDCSSVIFNGITYTSSASVTDTTKTAGGCDSLYHTTNIIIAPIVPLTVTDSIKDCSSVTFNGITYTSSASVTDTTRSAGGCDSLYHTTNIIIAPIVPVVTVDSIKDCSSVTFNGITYTSSASVTDTTRSAGGCDSLYHTTNIIIAPIVPVITVDSIKDCSSVTFNGITYTSSASVTDTTRSAGGCDSLYHTTNIIIAPITPVTVIDSIKDCSSVTFNGITYTSSASVTDTTRSAGGCDSLYHTTNIIIAPIVPAITVDSIKDCSSVIFNGITYTSSASVTDTTKTAGGCDSLYHTTNIIIAPIVPVTVTDSIKDCSSVTFNGITYTSSASVTDTTRSAGGCDSLYHTTNIIIAPIVPVITVDSIKDCSSVTFNGITYTSSASVTDTTRSAGGCDSLYHTTNIIIAPIVPVVTVDSIKDCSSVTFNGITYTSSASVTDTTRSAGGCDSLYHTTNIIIAPIVPVTVTDSIKDCSSVIFNGITYTSSASVTDTTKTAGGCDSLYHTTNIIIAPIVPVTVTDSIKDCSSITFNGITYTSSASVTDTTKTAGGCDSLYHTTNIIIAPIVPVTVTDSIKDCSSVTFNGITYTSSASVTDTTRSAGGCDSLYHTTNIIIAPITPVTVIDSIKDCSSVTFNGITYTTSASVTDTTRSAGGCDSLYHTTNIIIASIVPVITVDSIKDCSSVTFNGITYTSSASVTDTTRSAGGCDSLYHTTNIIIAPIVPVVTVDSIKDCSSVTFNGITYTSSASVTDTTRSAGGCDSLYHTTNIIIAPIVPVVTVDSIKDCSSVTFNGITYTSSASVTDTTRSAGGCDSLYHTTNIIIAPIVPVTVTDSIKDCSSVTFNGITYTSSASVTDTTRSAGGCDSLYHTTNIIITPITPVTVIDSIKDCSSITFNGITYTTSASVTDTTRSAGGCDSLYHTTNIIIAPIVPVITVDSIKDCSSVTFNGITYTSSASVTDTTRSAGGCDSLYHTTNIIIAPIVPVITVDSIKDCSSITFNGITYTSSASVTDTTRSAGGCDSLYHTTNIIIAPITPVTVIDSIKDCSSVTFNGITYTSSASVTDTTRSAGGCDSLYHTTNIIIAPIVPVTVTDSIKDCSSVIFNGITYTSSASVTDTTKTAGGCDSLYHTTNIIIAPIVPLTVTDSIKDCSSVTFNGITYTSSASVTDTTRSAGGCDSLYHTTNIIIAPIVPVVTVDSIKDCSSVTFNGITYTSSASVTDTTRSAGGCDSLYHTTNIIIAPIVPVITVDSIKDCSSVTFNGITYTSSASVTDTTRSAGGCDSLYHTTNIIIAPITPVTVTDSIKDCSSVTFNGITYTSSASVTDTTRSAGGCDSLYHTTNIIIAPIVPAITVDSIKDCSSVIFNGITYTSSASVTDTTKTAGGCDSLYHTTNIIIAPIVPVTVTDSIKDCSSVTFNGITYTSSASVTDTTRSAGGCDSLYHTTNIIIAPIVPVITVDSIKDCSSVTFNGITYTSSASVTDTTKTAGGCDSLYHTTNIIIAPIVPVTVTDSIKDCSSITFNGITYTSSASVTDTTKTAGGCDSLYHTTNIIIAPITPVTVTDSIKDCSRVTFNGITYTSSASVTDTTKTAGGCDSLYHTTNIIITPITPVTIIDTLKNCNSVIFNGITYTSSTSIADTIRSIGGCDSLYHTTNIIILTPTNSSDTITICTGALPYSWNGNSYTSAGIYNVPLINVAGCDSTATLDLMVSDSTTSFDSVTVCTTALPYHWNGVDYSTAGTYNYHSTGIGGCDSIATLKLNIVICCDTTRSTNTQTICSNQLPYHWNGVDYTATGSYTYQTANAGGCDSIATLVLTVTDTTLGTDSKTICSNQLPYTWNGTVYTSGGTYQYHTTNVANCDSLVTLTLTVTDTTRETINKIICSNQLPFNWNGVDYTIPGAYTYHTASTAGCDSIATLILTVSDTTVGTDSKIICSNQLPFNWNGVDYTAAGTYQYHTANAAGCDSIVTLTLTIHDTTTSLTTTAVCASQLPYSWNGNSYADSGNYHVQLTNATGCDSIATLHLTLKATSSSITNINVCPGQLPYSWNGNSYNGTGNYSATFVNAAGCDSVAILNLTVSSTINTSVDASTCPSALPYSWNGNSYAAAGDYSITLKNIAGCDSVVTLHLTLKNTTISNTNIAVCAGSLPYTWNGNPYTSAGVYNVTLTNAAGCDSIATLNLTLKAATNSTTNIAVCASQLPYSWNGNAYSAPGSYNVTLTNAAGCDSIATLNLSTKQTSASSTTISVCPNQLPVSWNGNAYSSAGSYPVTLTNAAGCDSIATLILQVKAVTTSNITTSICPSQLPYTWNGNSYSTAGTYAVTLTNAAGCDSIITLNLIVNSATASVTSQTICPNQLPYTWNGKTYSSGGTYSVTLTNANGCDSVATLVLKTLAAPVVQATSVYGCNSLTYEGVTYTQSTKLQKNITNVNGCDSIQIVTYVNITTQQFDLQLTATPNPVDKGKPVTIKTGSTTPYSITAWEPAVLFGSQTALSQVLMPDTATVVKVTAKSDAGCVTTAEIAIAVLRPYDFWVPNSFTPNDDGMNDYFSVYGTTVKKGLLRIYNQWGQLIYETTDIKRGWDGKFKGVPQPVGVYAYVVFAEMYDGNSVTDKGFLNLIR